MTRAGAGQIGKASPGGSPARLRTKIARKKEEATARLVPGGAEIEKRENDPLSVFYHRRERKASP